MPLFKLWGGSSGGSGGSVEPPKLNVKTYNKRMVKKSEPTQLINISFENGGDFRAIKLLQIAPKNAGNRISEALKLKILWGSMARPPLGTTAFGGRLSQPPFVKSWIRPRSYCSKLTNLMIQLRHDCYNMYSMAMFYYVTQKLFKFVIFYYLLL